MHGPFQSQDHEGTSAEALPNRSTDWSNEAAWQDSEIRRLVGDWVNTDPGTPEYEAIFERIADAVAKAAFARGRQRETARGEGAG